MAVFLKRCVQGEELLTSLLLGETAFAAVFQRSRNALERVGENGKRTGWFEQKPGNRKGFAGCHQDLKRRTKRVCRYWRAPEGRDAEALFPCGKPEARQFPGRARKRAAPGRHCRRKGRRHDIRDGTPHLG